MTSLERLMSETGMTEMVARRHLDDRRKVQRLVAQDRRQDCRRAVRELASASDLHHQLGKLVEDGPGFRIATDGSGNRIDTNRRCFEEIEPVRYVDMSAVDRLQEIAADHLATLSSERRAELQAEWEQS